MSPDLVNSIIPIYAPTDVSFNNVINSFPSDGKIFLKASGSTINFITCLYLSPKLSPASIWPLSILFIPLLIISLTYAPEFIPNAIIPTNIIFILTLLNIT